MKAYGTPMIEVDHLIRKFGDRTVLNDISFNVHPGDTLVIMLDRIQKPAPAHGVSCLRYTDTLVKRPCARQRAGKGKIADDPAISDVIIKDEPIAIVEARARRACQRQEKRVVGRSIWAIERIPVFIKNLDRTIDRLDIVIRADIAIGVRWQTETTTLA